MNAETKRVQRQRHSLRLRRVYELAVGARDSLKAECPDVKGAYRFLDEMCGTLKLIVADLPPVVNDFIEVDDQLREGLGLETVEADDERDDSEYQYDRHPGLNP